MIAFMSCANGKMDSLNITRIYMKEYALKLVKLIQEKEEYLVKGEDYFYLLQDLHSAMGEHVPSCSYLNTEPTFLKGYLKQLLIIANQGILLKDPDFFDIDIDLNKIIIL